MKKYLKILIPLIIVGGTVALWSTGEACRLTVHFVMEKTLRDYGGSPDMPIYNKLQSLHDSIVPSVCSEEGFNRAKEEKFKNWYDRTQEQIRFKMEMIE